MPNHEITWNYPPAAPPDEMENASIAQTLEAILDQRSQSAGDMERIAAALEDRAAQAEKLKQAVSLLEGFSENEREELFGSQENSKKFEQCIHSAGVCQEKLLNAAREYRALCVRFRRKTVNLGVIGKQGSGKSRFLQSLSGLTDEYIPSGDGPSCTGVTCVIENAPEQAEKEVCFTLKDDRTVEQEINRELQFLWTGITGSADSKDCPQLSGSSWQESLRTAFQKIDAELNRRNIQSGDLYDQVKIDQNVYVEQFGKWRRLVYPAAPDLDTPDYAKKIQQWSSNIEQYYPLTMLPRDKWAADGSPRFRLTQLSAVSEYISKCSVADGNTNDSFTYHGYHIAIREAHIRIAFTGIDARICLIDTVGIGDNAADTEDRMNRAIDVDSDGLIFLHRYGDAGRVVEKIAGLGDICQTRAAARPGDWISFLLNAVPTAECGDRWIANYFDPAVRAAKLDLSDIPNPAKVLNAAASLERYTKMLFAKGVAGHLFSENDPNTDGRYIRLRYVANVGEPLVVKGFLNQFLKQISQQLNHIDAARKAGAEKKRADAEHSVQNLMRELQTLRIPSGDHLDMISSRMDKKQMLLREKLTNYYNHISDEGLESPLKICQDKIENMLKDESVLEQTVSDINKNYDQTRTRLRATEKLYQNIRAIAVEASSAHEQREQDFKKDLARIFMETLEIDPTKLGGTEPPDEADEDFFERIGDLLFRETSETAELQGFFQSLQRFHLNSSTIMAEAIVCHAAANHLFQYTQAEQGQNGETGDAAVGPGSPEPRQSQKTPRPRPLGGGRPASSTQMQGGGEAVQTAAAKTPAYGIGQTPIQTGIQEIVGVLREYLTRLHQEIDSCLTMEKLYNIPPKDRLREETLNFRLCFGEPYEKTWLRVFHKLYKKGAILQGEMDGFRRIRNTGDQIRQYTSEYLESMRAVKELPV